MFLFLFSSSIFTTCSSISSLVTNAIQVGVSMSWECTSIPQAPDAVSQSAACSSSRSKVQAFPTREAYGLLWIWPDDARTSWDEAAAKSRCTCAVAAPIKLVPHRPPCELCCFMENLFDPTHTNYVHHGQEFVKGQRLSPETAEPMRKFRQVGTMTAEGGYELRYPSYRAFDKWTKGVTKFVPPVMSMIELTYPDGSVNILHNIAVPLKPGRVRLILTQTLDVSGQQQLQGSGFVGIGTLAKKLVAAVRGTAMAVVFKLLPAYLLIGLKHNNRAILNQDIVMTHSENLALARWVRRPFAGSEFGLQPHRGGGSKLV